MLVRMRKAQSTLEYALLIGVVVGALLYMQNYLKRNIQGHLQAQGDQISDDHYSPTLTKRFENSYVSIPHQTENITWHEDSTTTTTIDQEATQNTINNRVLSPLDQEKWNAIGQ